MTIIIVTTAVVMTEIGMNERGREGGGVQWGEEKQKVRRKEPKETKGAEQLRSHAQTHKHTHAHTLGVME